MIFLISSQSFYVNSNPFMLLWYIVVSFSSGNHIMEFWFIQVLIIQVIKTSRDPNTNIPQLPQTRGNHPIDWSKVVFECQEDPEEGLSVHVYYKIILGLSLWYRMWPVGKPLRRSQLTTLYTHIMQSHPSHCAPGAWRKPRHGTQRRSAVALFVV